MKHIIPVLSSLFLLGSCDKTSPVPPLRPSHVQHTYEDFLRTRLLTYEHTTDLDSQALLREPFYATLELTRDTYSSADDVRPIGPLVAFANRRLHSGTITLDGVSYQTKLVQGDKTSYLYTTDIFSLSSLSPGYHRLTVEALSEEGKKAADLASILVR